MQKDNIHQNVIKWKANDVSISAFSFPAPVPLSVLKTQTHGSPQVEVHDRLDGVPSSGGDVTLKARKQRSHNVDAVLPPLSGRKHS